MKEVSLISLYQYLSLNQSMNLQGAIAKNNVQAICSIEDVKNAIQNYCEGKIQEKELNSWAKDVLNSNLFVFSSRNPKHYQAITRTLQMIILYQDCLNLERANYLLRYLDECE